ncbi:hypothetical protein ACH4FX_28640 [Streptomyces sp. NPDC018019]|uniref:hypothetical protein n=1 Tax=Streptomyces sp. NPDC018019 TaxID=3365030 RepID=UPI00379EB782
MQSTDARLLANVSVPSLAAGAIGVAISAAVAGGQGALGAAIGTVLVLVLMGSGLVVLQQTAKRLPDLFQMMGLLLYAVQILAVAIFMIAFKDTTLFNVRAFAFTLLATVLVWIAFQARSYMKARILYVNPDSAESKKAETTGSRT